MGMWGDVNWCDREIKMSDTSQETLARRRTKNVRRILSDARNKCQSRLENLMNRPVEERLAIIESEFMEILKLIGRALLDGCLPYRLDEPSAEFDFYFWPGYVSNLQLHTDRRRFTLLTDEGKPSGIGWKVYAGQAQKAAPSVYYCSASREWFHRVLVKFDGDTIAGKQFYPGGMHPWISSGDMTPMLSDTGVPLAVISVGIEDQAEMTEDEHGILTINLQRNRYKFRGNDVAKRLNGKRVTSNAYFPSPHSPEKAFSRRQELCSTDKLIQMCREELYNMWLTVVLDDDWATDSKQWMPLSAQRLAAYGLKSCSDLIREGIDDRRRGEPDNNYRRWYTILLEKGIADTATSPEIGSAMILTSCAISGEFFAFAKPWIEQIYFLMRHVESATLLEQAAETRASNLVTWSLMHGLKNMLLGAAYPLGAAYDSLRAQRYDNALNELAAAMALHNKAKADVEALWASRGSSKAQNPNSIREMLGNVFSTVHLMVCAAATALIQPNISGYGDDQLTEASSVSRAQVEQLQNPNAIREYLWSESTGTVFVLGLLLVVLECDEETLDLRVSQPFRTEMVVFELLWNAVKNCASYWAEQCAQSYTPDTYRCTVRVSLGSSNSLVVSVNNPAFKNQVNFLKSAKADASSVNGRNLIPQIARYSPGWSYRDTYIPGNGSKGHIEASLTFPILSGEQKA